MGKFVSKKKIISFSLWGGESKYSVGALCNAEIAKIIYPGWICRFYCGESAPAHVVEQLKTYDNCEVIMMKENGEYSYMIWRFLPIDEDDVEIMLSRDTDSRLSWRERHCVDIFEKSDYLVHSIRDNINHGELMGGMWGMKKNNRVKIKELLKDFKGTLEYDQDQIFLRHTLGTHYEDTTLTHCSTRLHNFPVEDDILIKHPEIIPASALPPWNGMGPHFVGEIFCHSNYGRPYNHIFY
jgi:hypothetical protein